MSPAFLRSPPQDLIGMKVCGLLYSRIPCRYQYPIASSPQAIEVQLLLETYGGIILIRPNKGYPNDDISNLSPPSTDKQRIPQFQHHYNSTTTMHATKNSQKLWAASNPSHSTLMNLLEPPSSRIMLQSQLLHRFPPVRAHETQIVVTNLHTGQGDGFHLGGDAKAFWLLSHLSYLPRKSPPLGVIFPPKLLL